jgi:CO dehydrogenase/acetyl-CoA synthase epsilon subunit
MKSHIQQLVSKALKPHYRSGRLTREDFTEINKKICRKFYDVMERGEKWEELVDGEVEQEVDILVSARTQ